MRVTKLPSKLQQVASELLVVCCLIFLLLIETYFRYFEFLSFNFFFIVNIAAVPLVLYYWKFNIYPSQLVLGVFYFYIGLQYYLVGINFPGVLLFVIASAAFCVGLLVTPIFGWGRLAFATILLLFLHLFVGLVQLVFPYDFLIPSKLFGFFEGAGQFVPGRSPGLSFISSDFWAPISLALGIILVKNRVLFLLVCVLVCGANFSKVFVPMVLLAVLHFQIYGRKPFSFSILLVFIVLLNVLGFGYSFYVFGKDPTHISTFSSRIYFIFYMVQYLADSPVLGIGFDNFKGGIANLVGPGIIVEHNPHNIWIKFISELGVAGFAVFICFLYVALKGRYHTEQTKSVAYAVYFQLVMASYHNYHFMNELYFLLGLLVYLSSLESDEVRRNNYE
ncbi:O-antigen ligase family protein [Teredinibacter turnerae]|uniref:O-antigen ligase family protein n=1 Tax=Teredinibacter turnerae TaxID=2426 RepID=UPI0030CB25AA